MCTDRQDHGDIWVYVMRNLYPNWDTNGEIRGRSFLLVKSCCNFGPSQFSQQVELIWYAWQFCFAKQHPPMCRCFADSENIAASSFKYSQKIHSNILKLWMWFQFLSLSAFSHRLQCPQKTHYYIIVLVFDRPLRCVNHVLGNWCFNHRLILQEKGSNDARDGLLRPTEGSGGAEQPEATGRSSR